MKISSVLTVFILVSTQIFAQNDPNLSLGQKILQEHNIAGTCYTFTTTPVGTFIGSRLPDRTPVNYLLVDNYLSQYNALNSFIVFGYSESSNTLVVGYYNTSIKSVDTMTREFSTYNLNTHLFKKQVNYTTDVYKVNVKNDSLICLVNVKNSGGVGSHIVSKSIKLK